MKQKAKMFITVIQDNPDSDGWARLLNLSWRHYRGISLIGSSQHKFMETGNFCSQPCPNTEVLLAIGARDWPRKAQQFKFAPFKRISPSPPSNTKSLNPFSNIHLQSFSLLIILPKQL
jgi:hypothetical protein